MSATNGGSSFTIGFDVGANNLLSSAALQSADGWFTTLPNLGERNLSSAMLLGGTLFFTSYTPQDDVSSFSGDGRLYAVYYLTGTAYKEDALGSTAGVLNKSISLGFGLPSRMALHLGAEGTGADGTIGGSGSGCSGRVTGIIQTSTGQLAQVCGKPALDAWSRRVSWKDM
jgi:Tfp pilus tip-associated adhesin PilY1